MRMAAMTSLSTKILLTLAGVAPYLVVGQPVSSQPATMPVYVSRQDCARLVAHRPDPGVAYQPGTDVHGRYVAPADLPSDSNLKLLPDRVTFDLKLNPLAYGGAAANPNGGRFANTNVPLAKIEVDLLSGAVKINGESLDGEQTRIVTEACRAAGYR
jgi:hypothetical protein